MNTIVEESIVLGISRGEKMKKIFESLGIKSPKEKVVIKDLKIELSRHATVSEVEEEVAKRHQAFSEAKNAYLRFYNRDYKQRQRENSDFRQKEVLAQRERDSSPESSSRRKNYQREYRKRDKVKDKMKVYNQRPEVQVRVKAYRRDYNARPEVQSRLKDYRAEYIKRPNVKERRREYDQQPEVKAKRKVSMQKYLSSPTVQARIKEQQREYRKEYEKRPEVQAKRKAYLARPEVRERIKLRRNKPAE